MLTLDKFEEASEIVKKATQETKLIYSKYFSEQTGNKVYLKPENMQTTGAYKVRGAYYKISTLSEEERQKGLITASAGNHAQGVAYAAKEFGAKAVIVMPTTTPLILDASAACHVTAEYIVRYVRAMKNTIGSNVETLYRLVNNRVEALEFVIRQSSPILDIPLEKLSLKKNLLIASIYRDGVLIMPNGQDVMSIGDKVIVVTTNQGLDDISDIVKER